jgi:hypothetical protein
MGSGPRCGARVGDGDLREAGNPQNGFEEPGDVIALLGRERWSGHRLPEPLAGGPQFLGWLATLAGCRGTAGDALEGTGDDEPAFPHLRCLAETPNLDGERGDAIGGGFVVYQSGPGGFPAGMGRRHAVYLKFGVAPSGSSIERRATAPASANAKCDFAFPWRPLPLRHGGRVVATQHYTRCELT